MFDTIGIMLNALNLKKNPETKPLEALACPLSWKIQTAGARKLCKLQDTEFPSAVWELLGH